MSSFKSALRFGKWTLIPLGLSLAFSVFQLFTSQTAENADFSELDRFTLTNIFGMLLTLQLEVMKRWSSEERIIKFTKHLPTQSPVFQDLGTLIEDVDAVFRKSILIKRHYEDPDNPLVKQLQHLINKHKTELQPLKNALIEKDYTDSNLTNDLITKANRILAVSDPLTDMHFWGSNEGKASWAAQKNSKALKESQNYKIDTHNFPRDGICRIFILPQKIGVKSLDPFMRVIVDHVQSGVIARILLKEGRGEIFEGAVYGDIAYRETTQEFSGTKKNIYCFDSEKITAKTEQFKRLWNSAYPLASNQTDIFDFETLKSILESNNFVFSETE